MTDDPPHHCPTCRHDRKGVCLHPDETETVTDWIVEYVSHEDWRGQAVPPANAPDCPGWEPPND